MKAAESREDHRAIINEGIALHDRGAFQEAINRYEAVLKENPDDALTLYECAFSYFAMKDYKKSNEYAFLAAKYNHQRIGRVYALIGNNFDLLGDPGKAIQVYKEAIELYPTEALIHFNLAITLISQKKYDEAKKYLKRSASIDPDHPGSQYVLGVVYYQTEYSVPAMFSFLRFLLLEQKSARATNAAALLSKILWGSATEGEKDKQINVLFKQEKTDEGDFNPTLLVIGLGSASKYTEKNKSKSEIELFHEQLNLILATMVESKSNKEECKFVCKYYLPFFSELYTRKYVEVFSYYIHRGKNIKGVDEWLILNKNKVDEFLAWSKSFIWSKNTE
jgi:Tfp pilus assembly protein PilF